MISFMNPQVSDLSFDRKRGYSAVSWDHGDAGQELQGVAQQPVLGTLEQCFGAFRPQLQEHERDDDQQELDDGKDADGDHLRQRGVSPISSPFPSRWRPPPPVSPCAAP